MSQAKKPAPQNMYKFILLAAESACDDIPDDTAARLNDLARRFDAASAGYAPVPLTVMIYHLSLPQEHRYVNFVDFKADQGGTDYRSVLLHTFAMARGFHPQCRILYVIGENDDADFVPADVDVVRLPLNPGWLMYDRVVAMTAYLHSSAFASHTVFLDSDAFCNAALDRVFRLSFDVAVTFRSDPKGMMPLNEGVIFAAHRPGLGARAFFRRYLGTYEVLRRSQPVIDVYGDIRRWRGGQLALCGAAAAVGRFSEIDRRTLSGAEVRYLRCEDFNFFVRDGEAYDPVQLQRKYVLHLKGPTKLSVSTFVRFQNEWLAQTRKQNP